MKKHAPFLYFIAAASVKQRKCLLKILDREQVLALSEIAANILAERLPPTTSVKILTQRHRSFLTKLASKKQSLTTKKRLLTRNTSQLLLMLKAIHPVLALLV
jgi:hypothetical protein